MKQTKRSLFTSIIALFMCFVMLLGTTYAWFADTVTSSGNRIMSGNLKVAFEMYDEKTEAWIDVSKPNVKIFDYDRWEPGYTSVVNLRVANRGTLALKWQAVIKTSQELSILADIINVYVKSDEQNDTVREAIDGIKERPSKALDAYAAALFQKMTLREFVNNLSNVANGVLVEGQSSYLGIVMQMDIAAGNEYQGLSLGGEFDISILATQHTFENDSFGDDYDNGVNDDEEDAEEEEEQITNFIYRVGNQNAVTYAQLSKMLSGEESTNVTVHSAESQAQLPRMLTAQPSNEVTTSPDDIIGNVNVTDDGQNITFSGTGITKVAVDGKEYTVEVVNATNTTTGNIRNDGLLNGKNFVLLCDVEYTEGQTVTMNGSTIYGNGFKYDFSSFIPQVSERENVFVINMNSATIDNVQLIGKVYTDGAYVYKGDASSDPVSYMSLLVARGDSRILNSYVSGTRAPVRVEGNVTITNTTISGGNVANIDMKGGTLNLNNVTLINQATDVVGYGIFMDNDSGKDEEGNPRPITININGLTSYNWLTKEDADNMLDTRYMTQILNNIFADETFTGTNAINFTIMCLNNNENVVINGYGDPLSASLGSGDGRLWCEAGNGVVEAPEYNPNGADTGIVLPEFTWDEYSATVEFRNGESVDFDADLLTAQKFGEDLDVEITCTGGSISGKTITFDTEGIYTITYTVTDPHNYHLNEQGELEQYNEIYTFTIELTVNEVAPEAKHATIKIAGSETTVVEKNGKKYLVATNNSNGYTWQTMEYGFKYPELEALMSDGINGEHSSGYKACYPIFEAVEITDYENGGTGAEVIYNSATAVLPSGLKYVTDRDLSMAYSSYKLSYQNSSNGDTTTGSVVSGMLCFTSPSTTKARSEHFTWIEYSYTDNAGETYYFVIGYRAQAQTYKACVTGDTLVMLADGTQKRIDEVTYEDKLLVWNFFTGEYDVVPSAVIFYHDDDNYRVLNLNFEDGTTVKVINNHGFFDVAKNEFVFIDEQNVEGYIGHSFVKVDGDTRTAVKLVGYSITQEYTGCYSIQSALHINFITEGMFSMTMPPFEGWFDYFEIGEGMKYDEEKMQADIEKYGLFTYEEFAEYGVTYEQFIAFNGPYLKILVGRGVVTFDEILVLISEYVVK